MCLLMELEVWPNLVSIAKRLDIPVVVVNGRISDNSFSKYKAVRPIIKGMFQKTTLILAQTEEYAQRFIQIGSSAEKVFVAGSLKYDTAQIVDKVDGADQLAAKLNIQQGQRLLVAGQTGDGEEKLILDLYKKIVSQEKFKDLRLAANKRSYAFRGYLLYPDVFLQHDAELL